MPARSRPRREPRRPVLQRGRARASGGSARASRVLRLRGGEGRAARRCPRALLRLRMSEGVRLAFEGHTARITLARPEKLNPLDWETVRALRSAVSEIETRAQVSVVIVTGQGRSFSAGGDLEGYLSLYRRPDDFSAYLHDFHAMLSAIEAASAIYIAAVNGLCVAGGLELLLACDLVLAADAARIGDGHLNFGQLPGAGGSQRLPRVIGRSVAREAPDAHR